MTLVKNSSVSRRSDCRRLSSKSGNVGGSGRVPVRLRRYSHCPAKFSTSASARGSASIRRTCRSSTAGSRSSPRSAAVEQRIVRDAAPEEERQPRGQRPDPTARRRSGRQSGGLGFEPEDERRAAQHEPQRELDAAFKVAVPLLVVVEREQPIELGGVERRAGRRGGRAATGSSWRTRALLQAPPGRQVKIRARLGVSTGRAGSNGPVISSRSTSGSPVCGFADT